MATKQKRARNFFIAGVLIILLLPLINGFGVSIAYDKQNRFLELNRGEIRDFSIGLSASPSDMPTKISAEVLNGKEIARFTDRNLKYDVPAGGEVRANIRVQIPDDAPLDSEYIVSLLFRDITSSEREGTVTIGASSEISFKVLVKETETPEKPNNLVWWILLILIIIAVIIVIYLYFNQKKSSGKSK